MKIAIIGAGFSGSYLARRLVEEGIAKMNNITIYERKDLSKKVEFLEDYKKPCQSPCAWGVHKPTLVEAIEKANIGDTSKYILQEFEQLKIGELTPKCDLCTFNKPLFEWECVKGLNIVDEELNPYHIDKYDIVVDATANRYFMSKVIGPDTAKQPLIIYTRQFRFYDNIKDMQINKLDEGVGYEWVFPLGELGTHVGCGLVEQRPPSILFPKDRAMRILCACRGTIRLSSPEYSFPLFIKKGDTMVLTVGESAGMISSVTGGGNKEAIDGIEILIEHWDDIPKAYEKIVREFEWASREYNLIERLHKGYKLTITSCYTLVKNARRYGIRLRLKDAITIVKHILGDVIAEK